MYPAISRAIAFFFFDVPRQHLGGRFHGAHGVPQLMRQTGGELSKRGQAL